jgi:hypothetical protein
MKKIAVLLLFVIISKFSIAQSCESFDKSLFHMLPIDFPKKINCIDSKGQKQGWWIIYNIKFNPEDIPDVLKKGNYVDSYEYGKYENNLKTGKWLTINNVHLIYISKEESYNYEGDSIIVNIDNGKWKSRVCYNEDSTIIKSKIISIEDIYPIHIFCDERNQSNRECIIKYRGKILKHFRFDFFKIELENCTSDFYIREKKLIDNGIN